MLRLSAVLANPVGADKGQEYVALRNQGTDGVDLSGWLVKTGSGKKVALIGVIQPGEERTFSTGSVALKNSGDTLVLVSQDGRIADSFSYGVAAEGQVMKPPAFMSAEDNATLFEEYARIPLADGIVGSTSFSGGVVLPGLCVAGILATLAVYVLKQVIYDPLVQSPFVYGDKEKKHT